MAPVTVRNLRKSYGSVDVIHGVNIEMFDGEFVVLVGPSGCGKSTLLRMIAGLEDITSGEISIDGRVVNDDHPKDRDIAMVFQSYALYPHMTVAENMGFSLRMSGTDSSSIATKVNNAADILNLGELLERFPRELSGGQRQRVAMGRAIVRDPKVFLFDEPLSNLDAKLRVKMRTEIRELHLRLKTTIVYVTHDQIEAMTMADKIVVMNAGRVEQVGPPLELFDQPANLFVAEFIGSPSMNLIAGHVAEDNDEEFVCDGGVCLRLPKSASVPRGRKMVLGIRPEHFVLDPDGTEFRISVVEPTGSEILVVCKAGSTEVTAVFKERLPLNPGASISLGMADNAIHFFDSETGKRL